MKLIKVKVLKRHIERAKKIRHKNGIVLSSCCPIALAIKEKTHKRVDVDSGARIFIDDKRYSYGNLHVKDFVESFDGEKYNELKTPFYLTLEVVKLC